MTPLNLHAHQERGCWVVRLQDEIDHSTIAHWRGLLNQLPQEASIVLDLEDATYIDSAGIGLFLWAERRARRGGGRVAIAAAPRPLGRLLDIAGLPLLIACHREATAAVDALASGDLAAAARGTGAEPSAASA